jgi:hypothetical protein
MLVELELKGADSVRSALRDLSKYLDDINKKLDQTTAKLQSMARNSPSVSVPSAPSVIAPPVISGSTSSSPSTAATPSPIGNPGQRLVNKAWEEFSKLNPIVANTVTAIASLGYAAFEAAKAIQQYADFAFNARGGPGSAARLAGVSTAAGVSLDEASGLASRLPGGSQQLNQQIQFLRNIKDDETAARYAQMNGLGGYRSVRNMTDEQFKNAQNTPGVSANEQRAVDQAMADFNIETGKLVRTLQIAAIPVFVELTNTLSSLEKFANFSIQTSPLFLGIKWLIDHMGGQSPTDKLADAANDLKEATVDLKDAVHGGGPRSRNAYPASAGWYGNQDQMRQDSRHFGALA